MCAAQLGRALGGFPRLCQGFSWTIPLNYSAFAAATRNKDSITGPSSGIHTGSPEFTERPLISVSNEQDTLYKKISVLAKSHDKAVLDSYEYFAVLAAKELGITVGNVYEPRRKIERFTLLKSIHIYKKHRVQYETRTLYRCLELKHLTGSTADVYLEYIQRNLPEGVALEIKKTTLEKLPEHIKKPVWDTEPATEEN